MKYISLIFAFCLPFEVSLGQVSLSTNNGSYSQNFDVLPISSSVTWTNNSTITNWYAERSGTGAEIVASTGSSTSGNLYSFGTSASVERALGSIGSGGATAGDFAWGVQIKNNTSSPLFIDDISYKGEQWRVGNSNTAQTIGFYYRLGNSIALNPNSNAGWTALSSLNFSSVVIQTAGTSLDGNSLNNSTLISANVAIEIPAGGTIMFKWDDPDHVGNDDGLAIDNFTFTWTDIQPTPINLYHFSGKVIKDEVYLSWKTNSEVNNKGFYVLESQDGLSFKTIEFVRSKSEENFTISDLHYEFNIPLRANKAFYKLRQIDHDNNFTETSAIQVRKKLNIAIDLYPNPVSSNVLQLSGAKNLVLNYKIIDGLGAIIQTGICTDSQINISKLAAGSYNLVINELETKIKFIRL